MKEKKKALVNLIISALLLFCALFVAATSFGWFAFNDRVDGSGMGAVIKKDESNVTIEYYNINTEATGSAYNFNKVESGSAALGRYNLLNDKYQMLAKVSVKTDSPITITATTSVSYYMGSNDAFQLLAAKDGNANVPQEGEATIDGTTIKYTNSLSSVVSFAYLTNNAGGTSTEYTAGTDSYSLASLPAKSRFKSLVDKNSSNTIVNTVNVCEDLTPDSETLADGSTNYYVIIVFSYDEEQMSMVFSRNLNNKLLSEATEDVTLPFLCDFSITVTQ